MRKPFRMKIEYVKYHTKRKQLCSRLQNLGGVVRGYRRITAFHVLTLLSDKPF